MTDNLKILNSMAEAWGWIVRGWNVLQPFQWVGRDGITFLSHAASHELGHACTFATKLVWLKFWPSINIFNQTQNSFESTYFVIEISVALALWQTIVQKYSYEKARSSQLIL